MTDGWGHSPYSLADSGSLNTRCASWHPSLHTWDEEALKALLHVLQHISGPITHYPEYDPLLPYAPTHPTKQDSILCESMLYFWKFRTQNWGFGLAEWYNLVFLEKKNMSVKPPSLLSCRYKTPAGDQVWQSSTGLEAQRLHIKYPTHPYNGWGDGGHVQTLFSRSLQNSSASKERWSDLIDLDWGDLT